MIRFLSFLALAGTLSAQTPAPTTVLSKVVIRGVTCEISETNPREGIAYSCTQAGGTGTDTPVARGTLVPITASVTTTITVQTPNATEGLPPDQNTFVITANKIGVGSTGSPVLTWTVSTNGTIQ